MLGKAFGGSVAENYREVTAAKTASKTLSKTYSYGGAGGNRTRDLLAISRPRWTIDTLERYFCSLKRYRGVTSDRVSAS